MQPLAQSQPLSSVSVQYTDWLSSWNRQKPCSPGSPRALYIEDRPSDLLALPSRLMREAVPGNDVLSFKGEDCGGSPAVAIRLGRGTNERGLLWAQLRASQKLLQKTGWGGCMGGSLW